MKIVEIKGRVLKVPRFPYCWRDGFPRAPAEPDGFLLQVIAENALRMGSKATVSPRGAAKCWDGRPAQPAQTADGRRKRAGVRVDLPAVVGSGANGDRDCRSSVGVLKLDGKVIA